MALLDEQGLATAGSPGPWTVSPDGACIHRTAEVAPGVTVRARPLVQPCACVEAKAFVGLGARLGEGALAETGALVDANARLDANTVVPERAVVSKGAVVLFANLSQGFRAGADALLGYRVRLACDSQVGASATLVGRTSAGSPLARPIKVAEDVCVGAGVVVGSGTSLSSGVRPGDGVRAGRSVRFTGRNDLAAGVVIGDAAVLRVGLGVPTGQRVAAGATVPRDSFAPSLLVAPAAVRRLVVPSPDSGRFFPALRSSADRRRSPNGARVPCIAQVAPSAQLGKKGDHTSLLTGNA